MGIRIDADEFGALFRELEAVDKKLANAMKRRLREQAKPLVGEMRDAVTSPQSKRSASIRLTKRKQRSGEEYEVKTNTAALVAAGISFRMGTGKAPFVRFSASSAKLPPERKPMTRAFNKPTFRHPVFGRTQRAKGIRGLFGKRDTVWVEQAGRPYFGAVLLEEQERLLAAIDQALDDVARGVVMGIRRRGIAASGNDRSARFAAMTTESAAERRIR